MREQTKIVSLPSNAEKPEVVILADGDFPSGNIADRLLWQADKVVCCDGAAREFVAREGKPYAIVGDCDSLDESFKQRFAAIVHSDDDQQTNDLTKAIYFCLGKGFSDITILGATGKREDHTLANISLLVDYARITTVRMVTDIGIFDPIFEETAFESFSGQQISIFTLSPETLVTTIDLRYPLYEASLQGWWCGSLNQSDGSRFGLRVTGPAIVYRLFL